MFYNYVLQSLKNDNLYIGYTNDLQKRLKEHNNGFNPSTKPYRPWQIIYYEACITETDAIKREQYLKTPQGKRLLKLRLKDYLRAKKG
ncbi:MAG TPA: GIY-YIG nuclease family protein [Candidatus Paceibacterota bacterium]|nr:GIY-YIG nuclease family protein [Candidatus Pacearchaeota archaeon]HRZ50723.1 GIY-YIG nuclease family protein [Candidatus Paceibacterota bacterium]HSA36380.1 GIY-YIG nuclease family protein [Candidatus Paceibacterota bacterium]